MTGDCQVRICEGLRVKFPWSTRPLKSSKIKGTCQKFKSVFSEIDLKIFVVN